jgi:hypothetical protein
MFLVKGAKMLRSCLVISFDWCSGQALRLVLRTGPSTMIKTGLVQENSVGEFLIFECYFFFFLFFQKELIQKKSHRINPMAFSKIF